MTNLQFQHWGLLTRLIVGLLALLSLKNNIWAASSECPASADFLLELKRFSAFASDQDYSCLTNYPSISQKINDYQLVDIRKTPDFRIDHAWTISTDELKHKAFLKDRALLLLNDGFSRVELAADCAQLKKKGFTNVKFLVGGAPQWRQSLPKNKLSHSFQFVSAQGLIKEYFNGRVLIISASEKISKKLIEVGITKFSTLDKNSISEVSDLAIYGSGGGFDPVVYVGDSELQVDFEDKHLFQNIYLLQGGIDALIAQSNKDFLIDTARNASQEISFCAK